MTFLHLYQKRIRPEKSAKNRFKKPSPIPKNTRCVIYCRWPHIEIDCRTCILLLISSKTSWPWAGLKALFSPDGSFQKGIISIRKKGTGRRERKMEGVVFHQVVHFLPPSSLPSVFLSLLKLIICCQPSNWPRGFKKPTGMRAFSAECPFSISAGCDCKDPLLSIVDKMVRTGAMVNSFLHTHIHNCRYVL